MSFEVPETARIVINTLNPMGFQLIRSLIVLDGLLVLYNFHIGLADVAQDPARVEMVRGQFLELFDCLETVVHQEVVVALRELFEQGH
jgi:hypothetical protein